MRSLSVLLLLTTIAAGEVMVTATCPWEDKDGYTPVVVSLQALVAQTVTLKAELGSASATDRVNVEAGSPVRRTLLLPSNTRYGGNIQLNWSGRGDSGTLNVSLPVSHRDLDLAVLDPNERVPVPALNKTVSDKIPKSNDSRGGYHGNSNERVRRIGSDLPDRWQGWPAWLTLLCTPAGETQLDAAQRQAIATWTLAGGQLFVTDPGSLAAWQRLGARVQLVDTAGDNAVLLNRLRAAVNAGSRTNEHPVPGTENVPVGWFLTLAITFAVVVGPLNLWWVRRHRRPHLLLITVPVISAVTCVGLITVALLAEGLGARRDIEQLVVIDQRQGRACGYTAGTWFCGISPGSIALDPEDRIVPMDPEDFGQHWRRDTPELGLDWRLGQAAVGGWIPARVNRQLAITQMRPERRRIAIEHAGTGWRIANGLDVRVRRLVWRAPDGSRWTVRDLAPGAEGLLAHAAANEEIALGGILGRLGPDAALGHGQIPGSWTAELERPLLPIPGPIAEDARPAQAWAVGLTGIAATPSTTGEF